LPPPQIAIFVLPLVVLVGWIIHKPFMLDLDPFAIVVLTLSVIHAYFVSSDGNSNWCAADLPPITCAAAAAHTTHAPAATYSAHAPAVLQLVTVL